MDHRYQQTQQPPGYRAFSASPQNTQQPQGASALPTPWQQPIDPQPFPYIPNSQGTIVYGTQQPEISQNSVQSFQTQQMSTTFYSSGSHGQLGQAQYQQPQPRLPMSQWIRQSPPPPRPAPISPPFDYDSLKVSTLPETHPAQPTFDYDSLKVTALPDTLMTTTTITTERYESENAGGEEIRRRGTEIHSLLLSICSEYPWFNMENGFLCGDGNRWLSHRTILESLGFINTLMIPQVEEVNCIDGRARVPEAAVHPPNVELHLPMHQVHRSYMQYLANNDYSALRGRYAGDQGLWQNSTEDKYLPCTCVQELRIRVTAKGVLVPNPRLARQGYFIVSAIAGL